MNSFIALLLALCVALLATPALAGLGNCTADNSCSESLGLGYCYDAFTSNDSYCACRSGQAGTDCSESVTGCSENFNSVQANSTDYAPLSVAVFFDADTLNVAIASPLVTERNYTLVAIDDSVFDDERCTYPGLHWSRSFASCNDIFSAELPWADNVACGWTADQSHPSLTVYSAQMIVEHHDIIDPFGTRNQSGTVERVTQHLIPLTISFPKNVTVTSEITVQSPVRLLSSISRQTVAADGDSAVIEITTNLIWPYNLTSFTIVSNPGTATSYTPSLVSENCPNDGSSCTQVFRISIVTGSSCVLNGAYSLRWNLQCQPDPNTGNEVPQCAIQDGDQVTASLVLVSENYCNTIATSLPLSGSLASFGDAEHTRPKTQFLVGQTLYYRASVVSDNVTLTGTTINSVKLTSSGQPDILLYSEGSLGADGTAGAFATAGNTEFADFEFLLSADFIAALADDSTRVYTTTVIVDVDYQDTITTKRGTRSVEFSSTLNSQMVGLAASFETNQQAAGAAALATGAVAVVALIAAFVF